MSSYEEFERQVNQLILDGCLVDEAFQKALIDYPQLAGKSDQLLILRQKLKREYRK
jgi:hypothetical protein